MTLFVIIRLIIIEPRKIWSGGIERGEFRTKIIWFLLKWRIQDLNESIKYFENIGFKIINFVHSHGKGRFYQEVTL